MQASVSVSVVGVIVPWKSARRQTGTCGCVWLLAALLCLGWQGAAQVARPCGMPGRAALRGCEAGGSRRQPRPAETWCTPVMPERLVGDGVNPGSLAVG